MHLLYEDPLVFIQMGEGARDTVEGFMHALFLMPSHIPVQHPAHIRESIPPPCPCCWNMKYAWTIKSIWTIHLNIRYAQPSKKIIKPNTQRLAPPHTQTCINPGTHTRKKPSRTHKPLYLVFSLPCCA